MRIGSVSFVVLFSTVFLLAQPVSWSRQELQGTGLSVESPKPFELVQDKPDPFLEHQAAYILWRLSYNGIFATITYEKVKRDPKTPRQKLDETAALFAGQNKPTVSRVTDTTFLGQAAALFEEEFFEPYAKKNMRRKMLAFGPAGELTTINFSWPVEDPAAKTAAERIFNSVRKAGAVAAETSKAPPANWQRMEFQGLNFESPSQTSTPDCHKYEIKSSLYTSDKECYLWGKDFSITLRYRKYPGAANAPSPAQMLQTDLDGMAEISRKSTLNESVETSQAAFKIAGAEALKLHTATGYGTVVNLTDQVFIRRGAETWTVMVTRPVRWEFAEEAAQRILGSISFGTGSSAMPSWVTQMQTPKTAREFYNRALERFNKNDLKLAEADLNEAVRLDPNLADAYLLLSRVFCSQKLIISAIRMEDKAISLGGKVQKWCGRDRPPMQ